MSSLSQKTDTNACKSFAARRKKPLPGFRRIQENRIFIHISTPVSVLQVSHRVKDPSARYKSLEMYRRYKHLSIDPPSRLRAEPIADLPPQTYSAPTDKCDCNSSAFGVRLIDTAVFLLPALGGRVPDTSLTNAKKSYPARRSSGTGRGRHALSRVRASSGTANERVFFRLGGTR